MRRSALACGVLVEKGDEFCSRVGDAYASGDDLTIPELLAVEGHIVVEVRAQGGSLKGEPGKESLGARPGQYLGMHLSVGLRRSSTAHGSGGDGAFGSERELTRQQFVHATFVHHEHHQVGLRATDLKAHTAAFYADSCWC